MGSLGHVFRQVRVLPQRHSQLTRPFCTCRLSCGQAAAPRGDSTLLGVIFCCAIDFSDTCDVVLESREISDRLLSVDGSMSDNSTSAERKCLTDYRDSVECPTKQQVRNNVYKKNQRDDSVHALGT